MPAGRPLKFESPEELEAAGELYFLQCEEKKEPILITGLALALGTNRDTLCNYGKRDEFSDTIKRLKLRAEQYAEKQLYVGKNATGPIFALKNFGWHDRMEHTGAGGAPIETKELTDAEYARRMAFALRKGATKESK